MSCQREQLRPFGAYFRLFYESVDRRKFMTGAEKKVPAGILGILLGGLAIHKFYLGYTQTAIIQLVLGIVTCGRSASSA